MQWYFDNVSPKIREFIEGFIAFASPVILESALNSLGAGVSIDPKVLGTLCISTLLAYIRTRPTQQ